VQTKKKSASNDRIAAGRDLEFMLFAVREARRSRHLGDRPHPDVGAVIVKDDTVLASACHGDLNPCDHAEFTALELKLEQEALAGCTVYTTLEPCTTRNHPKVPCAARLIERRVGRVVIGMLDPNQEITGRGVIQLRRAGIAVDLFPSGLMAKLEELNRDFIRHHTNESTPQVICHGTKYQVPDRARFWNDLLEYAQKEFILVGNSNKSWFARDPAQSERLGAAMRRIVANGGRVVIISSDAHSVCEQTESFFKTFVLSGVKDRGQLRALRERLIYVQAPNVHYSAVVSDGRMLIMPRLNSPAFGAEAMVLELSRDRHETQFTHYKNDINRVIEDFRRPRTRS
jgi:pyrimidine deaminase RibD-like protein